MYRLHIDIPLDHDLETAKRIGEDVINGILKDRAESVAELTILSIDRMIATGKLPEPPAITYKVDQINYRLGNDEDRQKSNYYIMDSRGHVTHKKCVLVFSKDGVSQPRMD
jgi:hypothetical protein